ncbi:hypothetical protein WS86_22230 [Burkholderia savannae]|uniref:hypothetical protein n=1 Tax=Burkholderia savannae TaxID=1637837 RepID=UPI000753024A|nr:hypothetical protein [Burkholderia savannae]AOJ83394.1 hypothetical protein WS86_22230 [Burkholderia savannae]
MTDARFVRRWPSGDAEFRVPWNVERIARKKPAFVNRAIGAPHCSAARSGTIDRFRRIRAFGVAPMSGRA